MNGYRRTTVLVSIFAEETDEIRVSEGHRYGPGDYGNEQISITPEVTIMCAPGSSARVRQIAAALIAAARNDERHEDERRAISESYDAAQKARTERDLAKESP